MTDQSSPTDSYRNTLDRMVKQFQRQTSLPLWIFAHIDVVKTVALDLPFRFGPRGRLVYGVFNRTGRTIASLVALWIVGFAVIVKWWFHAILAKKVSANGVFVGFGAGSEDQLFEKFKSELGGAAIRLYHDDPRTWGAVSQPGFGTLTRNLSAECVRIYGGLKRSDQSAISDRFSMWMALSAMHIGLYVFVRTWAERLPSDIERVVFISADVHCFATVDGRRSNQRHAIEYWQHGLLLRSIIFPQVDRIIALNYTEGLHMRGLCGSPFSLSDDLVTPLTDASPTLLFASIYNMPNFDKVNFVPLLQDLFAWAQNTGLSVVIRPHPLEDRSFWSEHFPDLPVDQSADRFSVCIGHWKPLLVVSWFSTSLLDSLRLGVAPVLLTEGSAPLLRDMVLPLDRIALKWPGDKAVIETFIHNQTELRQWVNYRREEVFSPPWPNTAVTPLKQFTSTTSN